MQKYETLKYCSIISGFITYFINIILLFYFISSWKFFKFWTLNWIITIITILILFAASYFFFKFGNNEKITKAVVYLTALSNISISIIIFLFWGMSQIFGILSFSNYLGFFIMFILSNFVGFYCFYLDEDKSLKYPSIFYGIVDFTYVVLLLKKYVFYDKTFDWMKSIDYIFIKGGYAVTSTTNYSWSNYYGEMFILLIGELLFWILFYNEKKDETIEQLPIFNF